VQERTQYCAPPALLRGSSIKLIDVSYALAAWHDVPEQCQPLLPSITRRRGQARNNVISTSIFMPADRYADANCVW